MTGPNGDVIATGIPETSHPTQTLTLTDGLYRFKCDAHPLSMKGSFTVGTPPPPPPQCVVPNVRGLALAAATARIARTNCTTGKVTRTYSRTKKGRVIAQSPGPRTRLDAGASVRLTISRGPKAKPHRP